MANVDKSSIGGNTSSFTDRLGNNLACRAFTEMNNFGARVGVLSTIGEGDPEVFCV